MEFGVGFFPTGLGSAPIDFARRVEDAGFESLFFPDHTHIPVKRETPYPMPPYGDLPGEYYRLGDPFILLAGIATVTSRLKLGTGICLVVERDPIVLAKQLATLDQISGGRVILGVGAGWNEEEMRNHGTDPKTRTRLMVERIEAMRAIWSSEQAEYHGGLVDFDPIYAWPKPVQQPGPPVLIGGGGPTVLDRVIRCGDGWFPGHQKDLGALAERIQELRRRAAALGRSIDVTLQGARPTHFDDYAKMGVSRCVMLLPSGSADQLSEALREAQKAVRGFTGAS